MGGRTVGSRKTTEAGDLVARRCVALADRATQTTPEVDLVTNGSCLCIECDENRGSGGLAGGNGEGGGRDNPDRRP